MWMRRMQSSRFNGKSYMGRRFYPTGLKTGANIEAAKAA